MSAFKQWLQAPEVEGLFQRLAQIASLCLHDTSEMVRSEATVGELQGMGDVVGLGVLLGTESIGIFFSMRPRGYSFLPEYSWWLQNLGIKWATFQAEWVRVGVIHNRVNRVCIYTRTHTLLHRKDDSQKIACLFDCTTLGLAELLESPLVCILGVENSLLPVANTSRNSPNEILKLAAPFLQHSCKWALNGFIASSSMPLLTNRCFPPKKSLGSKIGHVSLEEPPAPLVFQAALVEVMTSRNVSLTATASLKDTRAFHRKTSMGWVMSRF